MAIKKPQSVLDNKFKSQKWDEITKGRNFKAADIPVLEMLLEWYAVLNQCHEELDDNGKMRISYCNQLGDVKAMPQLDIMKKASAEIRAINKQLGIKDDVEKTSNKKNNNISVLKVVMNDRNKKAREAAS